MAGLHVASATIDTGGGPFALPRLTLGVFLTDQPRHRFAHGGDRSRVLPLRRHQGWLLPAGSEGLCEFDQPLDLLRLEFDAGILAEAGLPRAGDFAPRIGEIDPLLLSLALNAPAFDGGGALYRDTMARAMAAQLSRLLDPAPAEVAALDDGRLRRAAAFIHNHLDRDLGLAEIAAAAAMSPTHFARAFKAATGASPLQYVIAARLDRASLLLRTTRLPVAEIAFRVGYNDVSRFGQHFRRRFATTPAAMRAG